MEESLDVNGASAVTAQAGSKRIDLRVKPASPRPVGIPAPGQGRLDSRKSGRQLAHLSQQHLLSDLDLLGLRLHVSGDEPLGRGAEHAATPKPRPTTMTTKAIARPASVSGERSP
jgi:hypothetical protein